jgi:hypothetical protein
VYANSSNAAWQQVASSAPPAFRIVGRSWRPSFGRNHSFGGSGVDQLMSVSAFHCPRLPRS